MLRVFQYVPGTVLDMRSVAGPFPMRVTYVFAPHSDGTEATIRVRGGPGGAARIIQPLIARLVARNLDRDLRDLEQQVRTGGQAENSGP